jgi:hypothetical protein
MAYEPTSANIVFGTLPVPTVTKLKPTSGPVGGGTTVTITGTNFTGASAVSFGSTPAASFTVKSATTITAVAPAESPATVDVRVTAPGGTSAVSTKDHYKFLPTVTELKPNSGPAGGGNSVTVVGTGFSTAAKATTVKFGTAKAATVSCSSSTQCTVAAPAHAAATVDVTVTVNKVTSAKTTADRYTYS